MILLLFLRRNLRCHGCMQKLVETLGKIEDDQAELVKDDIRRETQKLNKLDFIKFVEEMV